MPSPTLGDLRTMEVNPQQMELQRGIHSTTETYSADA